MDKTISRRFFVLNAIFGCFCRGQIKLVPTDVPWENEQWTLQCSVNPIESVVTIKYPDSSAAGNCEPANTFLPAKCTPSVGNIFAINETTNTVSMTRTIVNSDTGTWTCVYSGNSTPYSLSSPLPKRTLPTSSPIYEMHAMTAKAGSELTSDTEHSFYFHYGCVSTNLKFVWTTVPGSSLSDTSNINSTSLACTTNSAYMSTLATNAAILKSVTSSETKLKVSVYVDGYDNLAVEEYTYNVTFSPGSKSVTKCDEGKILGIFIVIHTFTQVVILLLILWCLKKKFKKHLILVILLQIIIDFCITAALEILLLVYVPDLYHFKSDTDCNRVLILLLVFAYAIVWKIITPVLIYCCSKSETKKDTTGNKLTEKKKDITGKQSTVTKKDTVTTGQNLIERKNYAEDNKPAVVQDSVMLLVNKIDGEIPRDFVWINEKGKVKKTEESKYIYSKQNGKCTLIIKSPLKEDSGIFQCVRLLQNNTKDQINVVLHVSEACPFLIVNPFFWENKTFEDLSPVELNKLVTEIKVGNITTENLTQAYQVDWTCYANSKTNKTIERENSCEKLRATDAGEYRCTVKLGNQTQTYFFNIMFLDPNNSKQNTNENVIGVPSILNSNRNENVIGVSSILNSNRHTGTSRKHEETGTNKDGKVDLPNLIEDVQQQPNTPS